MDIGLSPLATEQDSWTDSPALTGPSPKENGNILGKTKMCEQYLIFICVIHE